MENFLGGFLTALWSEDSQCGAKIDWNTQWCYWSLNAVWLLLNPTSSNCLLCHLIWPFLLFLPDTSNHTARFCKGQGCAGGCRTRDCFQPFADPVAYHSISLSCSGAFLEFSSILPSHLYKYIQKWEFRKRKKTTKSIDLAGGEFVIILFNGIDFLFIFTAEEKGRTVNKRIMLLSLWHTVVNSTIHFEWKMQESSSAKLPFPGL